MKTARPLIISLVLLSLSALGAAAWARPCDMAPDVQAAINLLDGPAVVQSKLVSGGAINYRVTIVNRSTFSAALHYDVIAHAQADGQRILFAQGEAGPIVSGGKTYTANKKITVPAGLDKACLLLSVSDFNSECGTVDERAFLQLDMVETCFEAPPPPSTSCVASSACRWVPPQGGPAITHGICWDHLPTMAETYAWTYALDPMGYPANCTP